MKIFTIIGARPQFIKASVVSKQIARNKSLTEVVLHTGQHFDVNMSAVFFEQLGIPAPAVQLNISGGTHGEMTGRMLIDIEKELLVHKPDRVLVYGDTNSTLAGALAASKLHIPVAHIEAGLRSFNMKMPEEINRILTDQVSDILFCPTDAAMNNLESEGFSKKDASVIKVGDVMQDAALLFAQSARPLNGCGLEPGYVLATLHRAENTDDPARLSEIVRALNYIHDSVAPVLLPLHPRTRKLILSQGLSLKVNVVDPVGYFEMVWLMQNAGLVLTDSGGVQKEAFFFGKYCVTMRDQTEWIELLEAKANILVGANFDGIVSEVSRNLGRAVVDENELYGGGRASERIVAFLDGKSIG